MRGYLIGLCVGTLIGALLIPAVPHPKRSETPPPNIAKASLATDAGITNTWVDPVPNDSVYTIINPQRDTSLFELLTNGATVFEITIEGDVKFGPGVEPTEAAKLFAAELKRLIGKDRQ